MLDEYTNQDIKIKQIIGKDEYGDIQTEIKTIKGRLQFKNKIVANAEGQQVTSSATLYTKENLKLTDYIVYNNKEFKIIAISEIVGLDGNIEFREVYV
ncbi:MAG: hypothetical protein ACFWUA_05205 [Sporanaerobacter sp.]|jgi:hypothetical protein|uniref:hypothetical protein n=1 Tax=Sporanaerobacter sp. TaxID=2010183 RepID=UPI003A0FD81D